jgi:nucleotide-binding universal stress UspA family protein
MFSRILVAMDGSSDGDQVFDEALAIAKMTNARLMLMHVLSVSEVECLDRYAPSLERSPHGSDLQAEQWEQARQHGLDILRSRHTAMGDAGISADIGLPAGNPGHQICEMAHRWGADLILIGRRGLIEQEDYVMNSVSNYVLHHSPCAVLVIPNGDKVPPSQPQIQQLAVMTS